MLKELAQAIDPVCFAKPILPFELDEMQQKVLRSNAKRLILNNHRQWGKSLISAIKALHRAIYYPGSLILLLSPSLRQSSELFRKVTECSIMVKELPEKVEDSKLFLKFSNGSRIISLPGREGTVRGYSGAALIIVDEASRVLDDLYLTIRPMLAVSAGDLMLISTPQGKRGFFYDIWKGKGKTWKKYKVTADKTDHISKEFLKEERESMPERWYQQEYFCEFIDIEGMTFNTDLVDKMFSDNVKPIFGESLMSDKIKPLRDRK